MHQHLAPSVQPLQLACDCLRVRDLHVKERLRSALPWLSAVDPEEMPTTNLKRRWYLVWFALTHQTPSDTAQNPYSVLDAIPVPHADRIEAEILRVYEEWTVMPPNPELL
jgi:hypothetical protein